MRFAAALFTGFVFCLLGPIFVPVALSAAAALYGLWNGVEPMTTLRTIDGWFIGAKPALMVTLGISTVLASAFAGGFVIAAILRRTAYDCCFIITAILFPVTIILGIAAPRLHAWLWAVALFALAWSAAIFLGARAGAGLSGRPSRQRLR